MVLADQYGYAAFVALVLDFGTGKGQAAIPSLVRDFLGIRTGSSKSKRTLALDEAEQAGLTNAEQRVFLNDLLDLRQPLELRTLYDAMEARTRVEGKHHVHDLQATILHLMGMNHERLTYRFQGRDFRLTDVHGNVIKDIIA